MKGITIVFLFSVTLLILASSFVSAQELAIPIDEKTVSPGCRIVKFDSITYRIMTSGNYYMTFSRVDSKHHRVFVLPAENEIVPYCNITMQWGLFPPVELDPGFGGGNSFLLGTETGYVEK